MDGTTRGSVVSDATSARERMRARAREQSRDQQGPYLTPAWLDRSFVLPVSAAPDETEPIGPLGPNLPSPRTATPDSAGAPPLFERPPSREVDFAAVVRRADAHRRARVVTAAGLLLALVAVVVFQASGQPAAAACAILAAVVALGGAVARMVLDRGAVPYLET